MNTLRIPTPAEILEITNNLGRQADTVDPTQLPSESEIEIKTRPDNGLGIRLTKSPDGILEYESRKVGHYEALAVFSSRAKGRRALGLSIQFFAHIRYLGGPAVGLLSYRINERTGKPIPTRNMLSDLQRFAANSPAQLGYLCLAAENLLAALPSQSTENAA